MTRRALGRVIALAFALVIASRGGGFAHSLPGSVLTFWQEKGQLNLTVDLPLEDLIVASPGFRDLETVAIGQEISAEPADRLAAYFSGHLGLRRGAEDLPLTFTDASIEAGENEHVGAYKLLIVNLTAPLAASEDVFPLTLTYDAVMHEIRNHRATAYWGKPGTSPSGIADFGFQAVNGSPRAVLLLAP